MLTDSPLGGSHVNYYSTHEVSSVGMCRHLQYVLTKQKQEENTSTLATEAIWKMFNSFTPFTLTKTSQLSYYG